MLIKLSPSSHFKYRSLEREKWVSHIECEAVALTEEELARKNLLRRGTGHFLYQLVQLDKVALSLATEEQAGFQDLAGGVCHDGICDVEAAEEDGGSAANCGGEFNK